MRILLISCDLISFLNRKTKYQKIMSDSVALLVAEYKLQLAEPLKYFCLDAQVARKPSSEVTICMDTERGHSHAGS